MLYIGGVNQPKLTTGRQPVTSRGKGNPMKANARQEPGSTPSRRTALSRSAPPPRRFQIVPENSVQNPYKSDHFRECEFSNASATTTYNFTALKCTDFLSRDRSPLPRAVETQSLAAHGASLGQGEGQTSTRVPRRSCGCSL